MIHVGVIDRCKAYIIEYIQNQCSIENSNNVLLAFKESAIFCQTSIAYLRTFSTAYIIHD